MSAEHEMRTSVRLLLPGGFLLEVVLVHFIIRNGTDYPKRRSGSTHWLEKPAIGKTRAPFVLCMPDSATDVAGQAGSWLGIADSLLSVASGKLVRSLTCAGAL